MLRTVSIPINIKDHDKGLIYMEQCNLISNIYTNWAFQNKSYNKLKAHKDLYKKLRKAFPDVHCALIQSIRDSSLESVKGSNELAKLEIKNKNKIKRGKWYNPIKPSRKPHSAIRYNKCAISLSQQNILSFSWSGKRIKQQISIPKWFKTKYPNYKFQAATISYNKHKKCFIANLIFKGTAPQISNGNAVVGMDRGIYNIISLSDNVFTSKDVKTLSKKTRKNKRKYLYLRKQLQRKGTKSTKQKLKRLSGREARFTLDTNHKLSLLLVRLPCDILVFEDLNKIRRNKYNKKMNTWLHNWSYYQLETFVQYKAEALGKQVVFVCPRYTSQMCSQCKHISKKNRKKSHFHCEKCDFKCHADINASNNIRDKYISVVSKRKTEQASVNMPNIIFSKNTIAEQFARGNSTSCGEDNNVSIDNSYRYDGTEKSCEIVSSSRDERIGTVQFVSSDTST